MRRYPSKVYVGSTNDLDRRVAEHNRGKSRYTVMANDWQLVYYEEYQTESEARAKELLIKKNKKYRKKFYENSNKLK